MEVNMAKTKIMLMYDFMVAYDLLKKRHHEAQKMADK